jgi:hypothetical protein
VYPGCIGASTGGTDCRWSAFCLLDRLYRAYDEVLVVPNSTERIHSAGFDLRRNNNILFNRLRAGAWHFSFPEVNRRSAFLADYYLFANAIPQTLRSIDDAFAGRMLRPSPAATADETGVLRFPSIRGRSRPVTPQPEKQCGAAFGWTTGSTFISRRTLGSVRLLLSTPLVQLRAA